MCEFCMNPVELLRYLGCRFVFSINSSGLFASIIKVLFCTTLISLFILCRKVYTGFVGVLESFEKLWKLIMLFSRTRKVLERDVFQNGYRIVLDFCMGKILQYHKLDIN